MRSGLARHLLTFVVAATCVALLSVWLLGGSRLELSARLPEDMDYSMVAIDLSGAWKEGRLQQGPSWDRFNNPDLSAETVAGFSQSWPQFRGPQRDGRSAHQQGLLRQWPADGPPELWRLEVGEGHAGVAIDRGRVYLIDYDRDERRDVIRCLSLADGSEIWSYSYPVMIKWNYGMSRTVPALIGDYVVSIGPLGHVHCLDARSGELRWRLSLIEDYGAVVPSWYMGQCVLVDEDKVILAPGGDGALLVALSLSTGDELWRTAGPPSPAGTQWLMTHSSIVAMDLHGVRQYVYAATAGVVSVAADDGRLLWRYDGWRVPIATVPSPLQVGVNRIMLAAGYDAGMTLLNIERRGDDFEAGVLKHVAADVFGVEQQTPIRHDGHVYAISIVTGNPMVCLDGDGNLRWSSGREINFERGPLVIIDDLLLGLTGKTGELVMMRASPAGFSVLGRHRVLSGTDAWAPMAVADGRLILRDSKELVCLQIAEIEERP